jgi:CheY-like chemotaxis protein
MKRVLVVDDEPAIRALVTASLAECEVAAAPDGVTALESMSRDLPDVILLDVALPGLNGNEVLRRLRAEDRTSSIPVILLTGLEPPEDVRPDGVLRKPFTPTGLRQSIEPFLSQARH